MYNNFLQSKHNHAMKHVSKLLRYMYVGDLLTVILKKVPESLSLFEIF